MNVLLLGEFSGFYNNLKEGLLELGHEVTILSTGDSWKKIGDNSFRFFSNNKNQYINCFESYLLQEFNWKKLQNFNVVQIVNPKIFGLRFNRNIKLIERLKKQNDKLIMSVAGDDYYVCLTNNKLRYSHIDTLSKEYKYYTSDRCINNDMAISNIVDGIIPATYIYAEAYRNNHRRLNTIPFPINVNKVQYTPQKIDNNKLNIFHGLNREDSKGTKYIREAMEKLKYNYPNDVEILIDGRMPLKEYLKVLEESNIIIDQALSYSYGMNAMYSMAMGKVVLSGNEPECQQEFGRSDIPVINITPSVEDIYNKLEKLVLDKKSVIEIGEKSRLFVEDFHHHIKVAQQYIDTWNSVEVKK